MQKPLALSIAVCLALTSCQLVEKSHTWETVTSVRPGECYREADPSASYAEKLHRVLLEQGIEHMVVTYQYHYHTAHYEEALGTRTAVVYRDNVDARYPWWLKDDRLATPFWLPNGDLDKQISFYVRRPVQVIEKKVYPGGGASAKAAVARIHPAQVPSTERVAQRPQPVTNIAKTKPASAPSAKPSPPLQHAAAEKPAAPAPAYSPVAVTRIQHPPTATASATKPANKPTSIPPPVSAPAVVTRSDPSWAPPTSLAPVEQGPGSGSHKDRLENLFRARNGTSFDPFSAVDRRKMEELKHERRVENLSEENGIRRGVDGFESRPF